jgi:glutamine amidotransferase
MTKRVTIIDYGVGNLRSVARAFEHVGAGVEVTFDAKTIANAQRLVLPGVGAFGHCMEELEKRKLIDPIKDFAAGGRPFLGICVGMQLMLEYGEEFGEHAGLGFIKGRVQKIPDADKRILPVSGWMELTKTKDWHGTILNDTTEGSSVYFVHSYGASPDDEDVRLAEYEYDGVRVTAAINRDNLTGLQFHPEKSGEVGLGILKGFVGA